MVVPQVIFLTTSALQKWQLIIIVAVGQPSIVTLGAGTPVGKNVVAGLRDNETQQLSRAMLASCAFPACHEYL